jgi:hypothetical protein
MKTLFHFATRHLIGICLLLSLLSVLGLTTQNPQSQYAGTANSVGASADGFTGNGWWWAGASQSGTGFFVEAQGERAFVAFFMYDDAGKATWYTAGGSFNALGGDRYSLTGDLVSCRGGQPAGSSVTSAASCSSIGTVSMTFANVSASASATATVNLPARSFTAERFNFNGFGASGTANQPETGWYWNAAQSGRGYAMEVQNGVLFLTMFHYNSDGSPTWNNYAGPVATSGNFSGDFVSVTGGQTLSGPYRPPNPATTTPGFSGQFATACTGRLTFPGGLSTDVNRFGFGVTDSQACRSRPAQAVSDAALKQAAATFPPMPRELVDLIALRGPGSGTFSSGLPFNDLEYTIFDTDYIDGETNGYDTFMPVDPSLPVPGVDRIKIVTTTGNVALDNSYSGQSGDRIILGTAEHPSPFFLRGNDGIDNDYVVINSFNYKFGHIQLKGSATDYGLVRCTLAEGCKTDGFYLFYTANALPDLVAFIHRCDDLPPTAGGNNPQSGKAMCNSTESLNLSDANQFRFAKPVSTNVVAPGHTQIGTNGREVVAGVALDNAGNQYIVGATDGSFNGGASADNRIFVARINANGSRGWVYELPLANGSLLFDATTDDTHLYAVGRTLSALPGFTSAGRWDAIILKLRLTDGALVASSQWGNAGLDGYGNVILDDAGNLYVSGQGSPAGESGTDNQHLIAKYRAVDLGNVWRMIVPPQAQGTVLVAEAWGGLSYIPGTSAGQGRLVAGGWFMGSGGGGVQANGFLEVWGDLQLATPRRIASAVIASPGIQADWVLDNAVDSAGNIYAVGFTSGTLTGSGNRHQGNGDAYIVKYDANLQNPVFKQIGTGQADAFRRMRIDRSDNIYAIGYTYGDWAQPNADRSNATGDVIVQKFDKQLNAIGALQIGTPNEDRAYLALRGNTLYLGGMTEAAMCGANAGSFDAFMVKVNAQSMSVQQ